MTVINTGLDLDAIAAANAEDLASDQSDQTTEEGLPFGMDVEKGIVLPIQGFLYAEPRETGTGCTLKIVYRDIPGLFKGSAGEHGMRCINVPYSSNSANGNSGTFNAFNRKFEARAEKAAEAEEAASPAVATGGPVNDEAPF